MIFVLEIIMICLVALFFLTQIIIPSLQGRTLFPMFNRKLSEAISKNETARTDQFINEIKSNTTKVKGKNNGSN